MGFRIVTKPIAYIDLDEAISWYENELPGLGKRFLLKIEEASKIQEKPNAFSYIKKPVRRIKVEKFPYSILYITADDIIYILGICHAKRSNAFIRRRLKLLE